MQNTGDRDFEADLAQLGRDIEQHRARIAKDGAWGGLIKADLDRISEEHERLRGIARAGSDDRAKAAATVAAEVSSLKSALERWMAGVDSKFTRPG